MSQKLSSQYFQHGALVLIFGVAGGFIADYTFNLSIGRLLPAHEYGDYKIAYAFAVTSGVLVILGGDRAAPRFLSSHLAKGDNSGVWEYLWFYIRIVLSLSVILITATCIASFLHFGPVDLEHHHPLIYMSFIVPFIAIGALQSRLLQAGKFLAWSNLPWRIGLPLLKTVLVILLSLLFGEVILLWVIATGSAAVIIICCWQWCKIRQLNLLEFKRRPDFISPIATLKQSVPMMLAMLVAMALNQIDLFMLEALGDEDEVGHFAAAATTAHIILLIQVTVTGLFLPLIAPAMEEGTDAEKALFWQGQKWILLLSVPSAILIAVFGNELLALFGTSFNNANTALRLLVFGYLLWATAAFSSTWLQYSGKGHSIVAISSITLLIDAILNYGLIPKYGLDGAAIATLTAMFIAACCIWVIHYRHSKQDRMGYIAG